MNFIIIGLFILSGISIQLIHWSLSKKKDFSKILNPILSKYDFILISCGHPELFKVGFGHPKGVKKRKTNKKIGYDWSPTTSTTARLFLQAVPSLPNDDDAVHKRAQQQKSKMLMAGQGTVAGRPKASG